MIRQMRTIVFIESMFVQRSAFITRLYNIIKKYRVTYNGVGVTILKQNMMHCPWNDHNI